MAERHGTPAPLAPPSSVQTRLHGSQAFKASAAVAPGAQHMPPSIVTSLQRYELPAGTLETSLHGGVGGGGHADLARSSEVEGTDLPAGPASAKLRRVAEEAGEGSGTFDWQGGGIHGGPENYAALALARGGRRAGMAPSGSAASVITQVTGPSASVTYLPGAESARQAQEQAFYLVRGEQAGTPYFARSRREGGV